MKSSLPIVACLSLVFLGCQKKEEAAPPYEPASMEAPPPQTPMPSEAASGDMAKSSMAEARSQVSQAQFVRSADLRFRCKSVAQATERIEQIVAANGGYVELNDLRSQISEVKERPFGTDSILEIQRVEVWNTLQLRVPNDRLDTVLAWIAPLISFLDNRTIRAQDVGKELRRAERERRRMERASERLKDLAENPGRIRDLAQIEDQATQRDAQADAASDQSDDLRGQVALSAVQIAIYQHREPRSDTLQRPLDETWREPFWKRLGRSFQEGWSMFQSVMLWLVAHWFWVLLVVVIAKYFHYKRGKSDKN